MELRYARFQAFIQLLKPFSAWTRRRRMAEMLRVASIREGMSVLDLGGTPRIWSYPFIPSLDITILNLPGTIEKAGESQHQFHYIEGDACKITGLPDRAFDFVFSNSVIEHVGGPDRRRAFAHEARRLGNAYWVQTPSVWFPIEAHTGMPLWWLYPEPLRRSFIKRWHAKLPDWTDMIEGTTVLKKSEVAMLFPEAKILVERLGGIPKSYTAFKLPPADL